MLMDFRIEDLRRLPVSKKGGKRQSDFVTLNANTGYLSFPPKVQEIVGLKPSQKVDLLWMPNNKGIVVSVEGGPFQVSTKGKSNHSLLIRCKQATKEILKALKTEKLMVTLGDGSYFILSAYEEKK